MVKSLSLARSVQGARYGERMLGHRAAPFARSDLRMELLAHIAKPTLAGPLPLRRGEMVACFGRDVDLLEAYPMDWINGWAAMGRSCLARKDGV
ncbi:MULTISPECIES: hypothetical protein [unclassified Novosphingobium]|uniref:hypothetical protein n=1 Tax=unclassified Novosphingobium TaxID=2644732 RepID=UPI000D2FE9DB|nr:MULTISPECIES: hypothetical protein [unclassified Novosphingobium]PTR07295.1 hypothetical protein C8K11_11691 [Novosphingobium sp. GV055]PUB00108.1 hypothetical protein C8K12_11691 [Novosphingobium sp. GV061]PUB15078.1 hypothetical protein C8K14_11691 [Novosphingobium sp. GV079]PUB39137.1 hypothetical protein C8K10_11691 [Novosphingobium sp. GV027]